MSDTAWKQLGIGLVLMIAMLLPAGLYAQKVKLTVVQEGAVVQVKPETGSETIQQMPLGATLEAERKVGEWYEVVVTSRLGVSLTGYIHERFIRVIQAAEPEIRTEPKTPSQGYAGPAR